MKNFPIYILLAAITLSGIAIYLDHSTPTQEVETLVLPEPEPPKEVKEYGINTTPFQLCIDKIRPNENLSEILSRFDVSYPVIDALARKSKEIFDVRKLQTGKPYCILQSNDSTKSLQFFIYEKDPIHYVVFDLSDTLNIYLGEKEVEYRTRSVSGVINSSLYMTMDEIDEPFELGLKLADIYAWTVDFYRLQKGDQFKVIFEEKFIEGKSVGIGNIVASQFWHSDKQLDAIWYAYDSTANYFNTKGESMRKAFLKAPLKFSRISSRFTRKRFHPIYKKYTAHLGTDYAAPSGTPIMAVGDGVILEARYKGNNGNYVKIKHNATYSTQYLHMSGFADGIKPGAYVLQGETIGYVGSTGLSTGPHVCFRFWKNGQQVDHFKEELPPADPIPEAKLPAYYQVRDSILAEFDHITIQKVPGGDEAGVVN